MYGLGGRQRPGRKRTGITEPYYDLNDDWSLIVSSFQTQYGIRLSKDLSTMNWQEFSYMLEGLSGDTPLGRIIAIRAETDPDVLKHMSPSEQRIRSDYRRKMALQKSDKETKTAIEGIKQAFLKMAQ